MKKTNHDEWINSLETGDICLNLSSNIFSSLQNWYRKKIDKSDHRASHGFIVKTTPIISEANGFYIKSATINKFIGDTTEVWAFRHPAMNTERRDDVINYCEGAEENGGTYSIKGIVEYGLRFIGIKKKISDRPGSYCTEYTGKIIKQIDLPYIKDKETYQVTPSEQLSWFLSEKDGKRLGWELAAHYSKEKGYELI